MDVAVGDEGHTRDIIAEVEHFEPIINPPSSIALAVSSILDEPVMKDGEVVPGRIMRLTISCDHRIIESVQADEFLQELKALLEDPGSPVG